MLINELAKAVHENAVAHGWWDDEREAPEIIALIHSEWSEALEEARSDMPLAYITLKHNELSPVMTEIIPRGDDGTYTSEIGLSDGKRITDGKLYTRGNHRVASKTNCEYGRSGYFFIYGMQ